MNPKCEWTAYFKLLLFKLHSSLLPISGSLVSLLFIRHKHQIKRAWAIKNLIRIRLKSLMTNMEAPFHYSLTKAKKVGWDNDQCNNWWSLQLMIANDPNTVYHHLPFYEKKLRAYKMRLKKQNKHLIQHPVTVKKKKKISNAFKNRLLLILKEKMIKNDFYLTTLELSDSNSWIMTHNGGRCCQ